MNCHEGHFDSNQFKFHWLYFEVCTAQSTSIGIFEQTNKTALVSSKVLAPLFKGGRKL